MPELKKADDALQAIDGGQIAILKKMSAPVPTIKAVFAAVCVLMDKKPDRKMNT